ncbi:acyl-[acyl-carrier-protein] thioesterase [Oenococcus alcoholitolerans]|uniref:acyl-[acyl-carrier-protein] thioesterase n=1 Tax=Oenococcus alcoholitolerans TaxID=931074 RepID=UPI003F72B366
MAKTYHEDFTIKGFLIDRKDKLSLPMIPKLAIETSLDQTSSLGVGMKELQKKGLSWVLLQTDISIDRRPNRSELVHLSTDPKEFDRFFASRDFDFYDDQGNHLIHIDSIWTMIDFKKRRLVSLDKDFLEPLEGKEVKRVSRLAIPKILNIDQDGVDSIDFFANYFDIDTNQHVNNANYLKYFLLSVKDDFLLTHEPKNISIRYIREVMPDQSIKSSSYFIDEFHSQHSISSGSVLNASAEIEWRS